MWIQMVPKTLAVLLVIRLVVDLVVCVVILDPLASPETVDNMLRFGGREEDDRILVYSRFEATKEDQTAKESAHPGRESCV
jgi:hypothetical protein